VVEYSRSSELDQIFSALADPTRRAILRRVSTRPATINEIARPFPISLNAISKHVMVLERAGLVRREIKGREHYCWIEPGPLGTADVWLEQCQQFWEKRLDSLETYVVRKYKARRTHGKTADGKHRIVVRRRMPVPREVVYQAWTDPKSLREWMCPGDIISAEASLDVRVGGSFRIIMRSKDEVHERVGVYQVVEPPAKLRFTWSGGNAGSEVTLVTVEFIPHGNESELIITHEGFAKSDLAQRYQMGWGTIARKFAEYLAAQPDKTGQGPLRPKVSGWAQRALSGD
jgi:uncharacterized protein YndB with AHSA1/START domain/DNA-binding transcriptional ArsR family regulator